MMPSVAPPTDVFALHAALQDAIEEVISSRSSTAKRSEALSTLERIAAAACCSIEEASTNTFLALQDSFECNVPSRMLPWIATATSQLESLIKRLGDKEPSSEVIALSEHLHLALSLIQGVALIHAPSKVFLGRPYALRILLHLLLVSRHLSSEPSSETPSRTSADFYLCSTVIDTLLCVLVDSPPALRTFEDVGGLEIAVRLLKRAGTVREVRMKSLEFFCFYLMDEKSGELVLDASPDHSVLASPNHTPNKDPESSKAVRLQTFTTLATPKPTQPSSFITPSRSARSHTPSKSDVSKMLITPSSSTNVPAVMVTLPSLPSLSSLDADTHPSDTPRPPPTSSRPPPISSSRVSSRHSRSHSLASSTSSRRSSTSSSSGRSMASSVSSNNTVTPASSAESINGTVAKPKKLLLLQRDVEYTALSPVKPSGIGAAKPGINGAAPRLPGTPRASKVTPSTPCTPANLSGRGILDRSPLRASAAYNGVRSTEEKRAILGDMLGNVDQLIEGVRKAGIWGLSS